MFSKYFNDLDDVFDNNLNCNYNNNWIIPSFSSKGDDDYDHYFNEEEKPFNFRIENNNDQDIVIENEIRMESPRFEPSPFPDSLNINAVPPKEEKIMPKDNKTSTTADKTKPKSIKLIKKEINGKIFNIKKVKKNMGRKRKNCTFRSNKAHTKNKYDNIIIKIKRALYNHSLKYINKRLKKSSNPFLRSLRLLKVNNSVMLVHKKEENLNLLESNLESIFSNKISFKYLNEDLNHNIETIKKINKVNDKEINAILKINFEELLKIYTHKVENKLFEDFVKIDDDIEAFKQQGFEDNYIKEYKYVAENFKELIDAIHPRRKRKI
jgi:hypothetical protein